MWEDDYDSADWWKHNGEAEYGDYEATPVVQLTEIEKKIAHYEKRAREHWRSWKTYGSRTYLYHYKQCNIKTRKLKRGNV